MKKRIPVTLLCLAAMLLLLSACGRQAEPATQGAADYSAYTGGDKVFAVQSGDIYDEFVRGAGWCAQPMLFQSFTELAEAVRLGRADAAMMSEDAVPALVESGAYGELEFLPVPREVLEVHCAPVFGNDALAAQFNTFLAQAVADGTIEEMNARYLSGLPAYEDIPVIELTGENGTLTVADTGNYPPMCYVGEDGEMVGYDIELAQRFAQYLGKDLELSVISYDGILPSVVSGNTDMSACFYVVTKERAEGVILGDPVTHLGSVLAVKKQGDAAAEPYEAFKGKRFSILAGSLFDEVADRVFNASEKLYFNNTVEEIEAVRLGKTDAALMDDVAAAQSLQAGEYAELTAIAVPLEELDLPYGVFSSSPDIISRYNLFLAEIEADGTLAEMQERWLKGYAFDAVMPDIPLTGENGTLTAAIMATYPPFTFAGQNGEFSGFDIEQLRRFAAWLGMDVEFVDMDFNAMLSYVAAGKADIGGSVYATEERKASFHFGSPDYVSKTVLVVRREDVGAAGPTSYEDFIGKTFAVKNGTIYDAISKDVMQSAETLFFEDYPSIYEAVKNGKVDAGMRGYMATYVSLFEPAYAELGMIALPEGLQSNPIGAISMDQNIIDDFDAFLNEIRADGTYDEMCARWLDAFDPGSIPAMPQIPLTGENGTLTVAISSDYMPFSFLGDEGVHLGFDIELALRFAAYAGKEIEFVDMAFSGLLPYVVSGKADLAVSDITITEERQKSVLFTAPYYTDRSAIIFRQDYGAEGTENAGFIAWLTTAVQRNLITENRWKMIADGLGVTMIISLLAQVLGTALGCLLCWVLTRKSRLVSGLGRLYSGLVHGLPMVVLLMISYYIIFGKTNIPAMLIAVCAFALVVGANVASSLQGAIGTVDPVEIEAARSIGFTAAGAIRAVTLPQAVKRALPAYCTGFIELVKATAIVGYIAIQDMTRAADIIRSRTYDAFFPLLFVAVIYLLVTTVCVQLFKLIVRKINKEVR